MTLEFKLPDLGEGVAEGEIIKWLVTEGQEIKEDDPMVEVMTDKATVQIPSPASGKVKQILAKEGQTVKVGTNLVVLDNSIAGKSDGTPNQAQQAAAQPAEKPEKDIEQKPGVGSESKQVPPQRVVATPATRKLARDMNVEIENVQGSGPGGRITEEDVKRFASSGASRQQQFSSMKPEVAVAGPVPRPMLQRAERTGEAPEERVPIHGIRKRISEKMLKSSQSTASVTHVDEVDFTELIALREATKPLAESRNVKLTFLPFIIKAVTAALERFPYFNASIDEEKQEFVIKHYYNIGVATDTPGGLIVPVVKGAKRKNVFEIAREIERLSDHARSGKIELQDLQGGTFTVTNIGTLGGVISTPIINVPEVAIIAIHKIQKKPVVLNDEVVIRQMAFVALTFDHRIVDGADAARFTTVLKQYLENPSLLFVEDSLRSGAGTA